MSNTKLHFDNEYFESPRRYGDVELYQAGDCYTKKGFFIPSHKQICHEISYIFSGSGKFVLNGEEFSVKAGDLFFCPKDALHEIISNEDNPLRFFYLAFSIENTSKWRAVYDGFSQINSFSATDAFILEGYFSELLLLFQNDMPFNELYMETAIKQIILTSYSFLSGSRKKGGVYSKGLPSRDALVYKMVNYIDNNAIKIQRLTDISDYMGFSYSYTAHMFFDGMHESLSSYYQKKRFEEAVKLLNSGVTVNKCAEILGYDNVQSFSRAFKKRMGRSPQRYVSEDAYE